MALTLSRKFGLTLGVLLALQAIYTAYFGMFEPGLHRTLAFGACILAAVSIRPLAARLETPTPLKLALCWTIDIVLLAIIAQKSASTYRPAVSKMPARALYRVSTHPKNTPASALKLKRMAF